MNLFAARKARAEWKKLIQGRPNFRVLLSKTQVAASLWDYGEDALAAQAFSMSDEALTGILNIASWYENPNYPLPLTGQRITHNHVAAFAAVTYFEGEVRALARTRRRPEGPARAVRSQAAKSHSGTIGQLGRFVSNVEVFGASESDEKAAMSAPSRAVPIRTRFPIGQRGQIQQIVNLSV